MATLNVNGKVREHNAEPDTPLLWVLREQLELTGTKYGCGVAQCGACTVHIDGAPVRSCVMPCSAVQPAQKVVTIEGLSPKGEHPLQKAWVELDVPQCGYCQSGMIMAAAALLKQKKKPTAADIDAAIGNICRCGTYNRVRAGILKAAGVPIPKELQVAEVRHETGERSMKAAAMDRRAFLGSVAAGSLVLSVGAGAQSAGPNELTAWVVVQPDDRVIVRIARSEMGQGTLTGLAQLVAEELDADWSKVSTEYPTPGESLKRKRPWGNFSTGGSRGVRESQAAMRKGGAQARAMLVQAAATQWGVPAAECSVQRGVVMHGSKQARFGALAAAAAQLTPPEEVKLKDPKTWTLAGKPLARLDTVDKTTGAQVYGADLRLPGMLNAAVKACPVFGGKLKAFQAEAVMGLPGVKKVVQVDATAVAVVADTWWHAKKALDALPIDWDLGPHAGVQQADIEARVAEGLTAEQAFVGNSNGDAKAQLAKAARTLEAVYAFPFQHHVTMEPMNATARWTPERCEVWTPTQNGEGALAAAAEAAGLPPAQCEVYKLHLGGGFGRRGAVHDWVRQTVSIAKQLPGTPVKLLWSREEDMAHGVYHPITQAKLTAGLSASGELEALHLRISGQSIIAGLFPQNLRNGMDPVVFQGLNAGGGEAMIGYGVPHLLVDHAMRNPHVPPGFWRGVNLNQNTFYLESFLDEIARTTKQDPLALRRKLMANHPKHLAVLEAVAKQAGWGKPMKPVAGRKLGRGLAQCHGFGSYVAACAEVAVDKDGTLHIQRIVAATDCGHAVNPQQIAAQVEGSFAYGLSTLYGQCTVKDGRMEQLNVDTYPILRMAQMPRVETIVMPSGDFWGGVGEPTIAVAVPAVLNAVYAATGKRVRKLPLGEQLRA